MIDDVLYDDPLSACFFRLCYSPLLSHPMGGRLRVFTSRDGTGLDFSHHKGVFLYEYQWYVVETRQFLCIFKVMGSVNLEVIGTSLPSQLSEVAAVNLQAWSFLSLGTTLGT